MQRYQQKIFAYLFRFLYQNREAALDLTQDVFIKVYENLGSVDMTRPIQPWIYRIAHNEAANYLRTISRKKESQLEDEQWNTFSGPETVDSMEAEDNKELILKALEKIDPKYREVLVLFFFEDRSYKEIAEILDASVNTVGTLISRAKKQMEKTLREMTGGKNPAIQFVLVLFLIAHLFSEPEFFKGVWQWTI
jgi:RNA polymerase sigma-70 factor (ECF subfamily)